MDRTRRLHDLWSWLIPFRVVAETESLQAASELLHVAPSALSRSVHLLEDRLGVELFDRRANRLCLNANGRRLVEAIRVGMRGIDDAVVEVLADASAQSVRIACPGELLPMVMAPIGALSVDIAAIRLAIDEPTDGDSLAPLRRGIVDVAIIITAIAAVPEDAMVVRRVGALTRRVYVAGRSAASPAACELRYAARVDRDGVIRDGVPADRTRAIALRAPTGAALIEAVRSGGLAAVLAVAVGRAAGFTAVEVGFAIAPIEVAVVTRAPLAAPGVHDGLADRLASAMRAVAARPD